MAYIIIDKNSRIIKSDRNGMLCIFDTNKQAVSYIRNINESDKPNCEVVTMSLGFRKKQN